MKMVTNVKSKWLPLQYLISNLGEKKKKSAKALLAGYKTCPENFVKMQGTVWSLESHILKIVNSLKNKWLPWQQFLKEVGLTCTSTSSYENKQLLIIVFSSLVCRDI